MRILHLNALDTDYGCSVRARAICELLRGLGHEVTYVEPNLSDPGKDDVSFQSGRGLIDWLILAFRFFRMAAFGKYDVLFVSKPIPPNVAAEVAARLRGKSVVVDCDDLDAAFQRSRARRALFRTAMTLGLRLSRCVVTHNHLLAKRVARAGARRIEIVAQGVDAALFDPRRIDREEARRELGLADRKVLGVVVTMTSGGARCLPTLFRAVAAPLRDNANAVMMIVGGGPLLEQMQKAGREALSKGVIFTGKVAHEDVPRYLAAFDFGLVYMLDDEADRERSSLKLMEYLAMGLPVLARLTGASRSDFSHLCNCVENEEEMCAACLRWLDELPPRGEHVEYVRQEFSWDAIAPRFAQALAPPTSVDAQAPAARDALQK